MNGVNGSRSRRCTLAVIVLLLVAPAARAHLNTTGMGPVYDGLLHFLLSPEDFVPALALALLAGLCGTASGRRVLFVLPATWFLGGLAGSTVAATDTAPVLSALCLVLLGGAVAADLRLPLFALTVLAALLGTVRGFLNGTGMDRSAASFAALLGITAAVFVLVSLAAALVVALRPSWARVAVRVAGSWIAASGILLLGWSFRPGH